MKNKIEKLYTDGIYNDVAPNVFAKQVLDLFNVSGCGLLVLNKDLAGHTAGEVKSKDEWMQIIGRKGDIDLKYKSDAEWFSHYR